MQRYALAGAALLASIAWLILAIIHIQHPGPINNSNLETTLDYTVDITFAVALVLTAVSAFALQRLIPAGRIPVYLVITGELLVFVGVLAGLMIGESPSWFAAVGVPGNLLALVGFAIFGWRGFKSRTVSRVIAVLLFLMVIAGVIGAEIGGSLVPAAVLGYVSVSLLRRTETPRAHVLVSTGPSART